MKENYSDQQQKIYSDYSKYSTESLEEMVKSDKNILEEIEILKDILNERNPISPASKEMEEKIQSIYQELENATNKAITNPLYGVHGWLKFFVVSYLYIIPVISILGAISMLVMQENYSTQNLIMSGISLFIAFIGFIVAKDLRDINQGAVKNAKFFLQLVLGLNIVTTLLSLFMLPENENAGKLIINFGIGVIAFAIWYSYFKVSERVKITYPDWNE